MSPEQLRLSGFDFLRRGNYEKAYACLRLAAYFFEVKQAKYSHAARAANACIAALRPIQGQRGASRLLEYSIWEASRIASRKECGVIWRAEFLRQLQLVLFDHSEFELATECCHHARVLFARATKASGPYPEDVDLIKAHAATAHLFVTDRLDDELLGDFEASTETFRKHGEWRGLFTNYDVWSQMEYERGNISKARDLVDEALVRRERISNPWITAQLLYREGLLRLAQNDRRPRVKEALQQALDMFQRFNIIPEPRRGACELGPGALLRRLGLADAPLITVRGTFPIDGRDLRRIVRSVE